MGYDIYAIESVLWEHGDEIAYHRAYMGAFRMMREQGYDWFGLIDAEDCDGGVSGNGNEKMIIVENLRNAYKILKEFEVTRWPRDGENEICYRQEKLMEFMDICIKWCEEHDRNSILIYFG